MVATLLVGILGFAHSWLTVFVLLTLAWVGRGIVRAPRDSFLADSVDPGILWTCIWISPGT